MAKDLGKTPVEDVIMQDVLEICPVCVVKKKWKDTFKCIGDNCIHSKVFGPGSRREVFNRLIRSVGRNFIAKRLERFVTDGNPGGVEAAFSWASNFADELEATDDEDALLLQEAERDFDLVRSFLVDALPMRRSHALEDMMKVLISELVADFQRLFPEAPPINIPEANPPPNDDADPLGVGFGPVVKDLAAAVGPLVQDLDAAGPVVGGPLVEDLPAAVGPLVQDLVAAGPVVAGPLVEDMGPAGLVADNVVVAVPPLDPNYNFLAQRQVIDAIVRVCRVYRSQIANHVAEAHTSNQVVAAVVQVGRAYRAQVANNAADAQVVAGNQVVAAVSQVSRACQVGGANQVSDAVRQVSRAYRDQLANSVAESQSVAVADAYANAQILLGNAQIFLAHAAAEQEDAEGEIQDP